MRRCAFTLIEMLVALAITLIMMGAVVTLFSVVAESVSESRAAIEMSDRLRHARNTLQADLDGATATMQPPLRPSEDEGYLEYIEGENFDGSPGTIFGSVDLFGDLDDFLMLTVRRSPPFIGKLNGTMIESQTAEVIYFTIQDGPIIDATQDPPVQLFTLYRRVLLVAPSIAGPIVNPPPHYYDSNDISMRFDETASAFFSNSLGDLTKRENRFAHTGNAAVAYGDFPFPVRISTNLPSMWPPARPTENAFLLPMEDARVGDDVLLGNVLSFDIEAFDPGAPLFVTGGVAVGPRDPGWVKAVNDWNGAGKPAPPDPTAPVGFGEYADLYYGTRAPYSPLPGMPTPQFAVIPNALSQLSAPPSIYDTWSLHYENDGEDQDGDGDIDEGTNGLDEGPNGIVDDLRERETLPPYSVGLRGIRVTLRVYEPSSQQIREAVVVSSFIGN